MKKTFITHMPDKTGALLNASRIISMAGGNITRVSYNKAIDLHMLFLEVSAGENQLIQIEKQLNDIGYIMKEKEPGQTILLEFQLRNAPNSVRPVLELIHRCDFNITYISGQESDTEYQTCKIGLYVDDQNRMTQFLEEAAHLCKFKILNYDKSQRILDNTVFYLSFARQVSELLGLTSEQEDTIITDANRIMQNLDERSGSPYQTFSYIGKYAEMLHSFKGDAFVPIITHHALKAGGEMICIEPPCGSNTYIFERNHELLMIDSGYSCFENEMITVFRSLFPDFDGMKKSLILTHPDIDHYGLMHLFDQVFVSADAYRDFVLESKNQPCFREQNPLHAPYYRISRILCQYENQKLDNLCIVGEDLIGDPITFIGDLDFHDLHFNIYAGNSGHTKGEIVICEEENKLLFTGDIVVNIKGFRKEQAAFNALAPYLMTSVNTDSALASAERNAVLKQFDPNIYSYCCGHGAIMKAK